jgi:alanine-glyoxylate transaminase/(R)-3-amino-2-methylpropionate-pyruvate transaminase
MLAVELVKSRKTKEPAPDLTAKVFEETRFQGLVMSKSGPYRSILRMVPPLCLQLGDVDTVVDGLDRAFAAAL